MVRFNGFVRSSVVVPLLALAACGGPPALYGDKSSPVTNPGGNSNNNTPPPDMAMVAYPAGPYGNMKGDVIAEQMFEGGYRLDATHTDSSALDWAADIKFNDFHANPNCKALVISYSATWCGACQQEQGALPAEVDGKNGFCVLNIHIEGPQNGSNMVTKDDVDAWTQRFHQTYPVVLGNAAVRQLWNGWGQNGSIGLPFNFVVKPDTMEIMDAIQGFDPMIKDHAMQLCGQ